MGVAIDVQGLTKSFGSQQIWNDVTLTLPPGEISVMLGPSGTGKSVFLKTLVGLLKPDKGSIVINGDDTITWNGNPVNMVQLRQLLDATQQLDPTPELHMQPESEARYEIVDEVLAETKRAQVQKMGFVGNEYYMNVF